MKLGRPRLGADLPTARPRLGTPPGRHTLAVSSTELRELLARRSKPQKRGIGAGWAKGVRALAERGVSEGEIIAVAFFFPDA